MNPISDLIDKDFNELTFNELVRVINAYCDENKYFNEMLSEVAFPYSKAFRNPANAISYFEGKIGPIYLLKDFFIYWTK